MNLSFDVTSTEYNQRESHIHINTLDITFNSMTVFNGSFTDLKLELIDKSYYIWIFHGNIFDLAIIALNEIFLLQWMQFEFRLSIIKANEWINYDVIEYSDGLYHHHCVRITKHINVSIEMIPYSLWIIWGCWWVWCQYSYSLKINSTIRLVYIWLTNLHTCTVAAIFLYEQYNDCSVFESRAAIISLNIHHWIANYHSFVMKCNRS